MNLVDFLWTLFVIYFMIIYFMMLFRIITDLFRDHEMSGVMKAVWLVFIFVVPLIAMLIYVITRGSGMAKRDLDQVAKYQEAQESYIRNVASSGTSPAEQITKAQSLLASGAITQTEFDALKAKALA